MARVMDSGRRGARKRKMVGGGCFDLRKNFEQTAWGDGNRGEKKSIGKRSLARKKAISHRGDTRKGLWAKGGMGGV